MLKVNEILFLLTIPSFTDLSDRRKDENVAFPVGAAANLA
jgi:hypothetical protein